MGTSSPEEVIYFLPNLNARIMKKLLKTCSFAPPTQLPQPGIMSTTTSSDVGTMDPISAALTAMIDAEVTFNDVYMCTNQDDSTAYIHMDVCNINRRCVRNALNTYFTTRPVHEGYEISKFKEWIGNISTDNKFNKESEPVDQDKLIALDCMNYAHSDNRRVIIALDTYLTTYPDHEDYEIFQFQKWICNISDKATSEYIDTSRRSADTLDAANASLQAATKVYEALITKTQMYDMQTAKFANDSD